MNKYERAREDIEKKAAELWPQMAEERRKAAEEAKKQQEEEIRKKESIERQQIEEENIAAVLVLFDKVNSEIFGNRGKIEPWRETTRTQYIEQYRVEREDGYWAEWMDDWGDPRNHMSRSLPSIEYTESYYLTDLCLPDKEGVLKVIRDGKSVNLFHESYEDYEKAPDRLEINVQTSVNLTTTSNEFKDQFENHLIKLAIDIEAKKRASTPGIRPNISGRRNDW